MLVYLIQITLNLSITYIIYKYVLENLKIHRFNRFYLLISVILSLLLPLNFVNINTSFPEVKSTITEISEIIIIQNDSTTQVTTSFFNLTTILYAMYFLGLGISIFKYCRHLYTLQNLKKQGKQVIENEQSFVLLSNTKHPFTFGKTIYLPNDIEIDDSNPIIIHEKVHVKQNHSLDILFIELLQCLFWFHPIFYFLKNSIALNHEFLADNEVTINQINTADYLKLLLNQTYESNELPLSSSFNFNLTKKRFIMITKKDNPFKNALSITIACAAITFTGILSTQAQEKKAKIETAIKVDEKAEYPGGIEAFQNYFISSFHSDNIKKDNSEERIKVILQFNIEKDGSVADAEIFRSDAEEEVNNLMLDILKKSKKWKPAKIAGKTIKSQFTLPITILVDDSNTDSQ